MFPLLAWAAWQLQYSLTAWRAFRKHITKPPEQVAAPDCISCSIAFTAWPFFGYCTADSQTDAGIHQLYNNGSHVLFSTAWKKASVETRVEGQISQTIFSHLLPLSRRRESSWAREMGRGSANTVQVTDSAHGGVVSDPEYLLHWQEHFQN